MKKHSNYFINDTEVPGVTTVLNVLAKPGLEIWYGKLGFKEAYRQKMNASEFGNLVHSTIEEVCTQENPTIPEHLVTVISNFKKWEEKNIEKWICFEQAVYNDSLMYAGTTDAFAILKTGELALIDFKTCRNPKNEYHLQLSAYLNANRTDAPIELSAIKKAILVYMSHETFEWTSVEVPLTPELFETFKSCLTIYYWKKNYGKVAKQRSTKHKSN